MWIEPLQNGIHRADDLYEMMSAPEWTKGELGYGKLEQTGEGGRTLLR